MKAESRIAEKVSQMRGDQQMSIEELAEKSQLNPTVIEHIESGQLLPSLAPLMKIARGLGVRLGTFLDDEPYGGAIVVRNGDAEEVMRFSGAGPCDQSTLDFYSLAAHKKDRHMEPFLIQVLPASDAAPQLSSHEGEEFIYVLDGAVQVRCGNEHYVLTQGDSIYYDSVVPHEVRCEGSGAARILALVYAPF